MHSKRLKTTYEAIQKDVANLFNQLVATCPMPCNLVENPSLHVYGEPVDGLLDEVPEMWYVNRQGYHVNADIVSVFEQDKLIYIAIVDEENSHLGFRPTTVLNTQDLLDLCSGMVHQSSLNATLVPTMNRLMTQLDALETEALAFIQEQGHTRLVDQPETYEYGQAENLPTIWFVDKGQFHITAQVLETTVEEGKLMINVLDDQGDFHLYSAMSYLTIEQAIKLLSALETPAPVEELQEA